MRAEPRRKNRILRARQCHDGNSQQNGHQPHRRLCMGQRHGAPRSPPARERGLGLAPAPALPYKNRGYPRPEPQLCRAGVCFRQQRHLRTAGCTRRQSARYGTGGCTETDTVTDTGSKARAFLLRLRNVCFQQRCHLRAGRNKRRQGACATARAAVWQQTR